MARWPAGDQPLAPFFGDEVRRKGNGFIPCGACSVATSEKEWAICSRRLLTFRGRSKHQEELRHAIASVSGFSAGDQVKVWSEITIRHESTHINYRLDYVLATPAKPPVIVEIMTASTSGGNKERRTDIKNAFCDCVLYSQGLLQSQPQSPGVNVRQVWARMASQLIVKSQLANAWGGRAIWVVQDALMDYIRHNTGNRSVLE